ncbi:hypothetical protein CL673_01435 [Candidatus Bathyarchaeota archaeon]|nr:hypothetical protein [Candidatus Bathyarchaeota archaeon]
MRCTLLWCILDVDDRSQEKPPDLPVGNLHLKLTCQADQQLTPQSGDSVAILLGGESLDEGNIVQGQVLGNRFVWLWGA